RVRRRLEVVSRRRLGQAEPGEIGRRATELAGELADEMPVQERPNRIAVQQQEDWAASFVDVMHPCRRKGRQQTSQTYCHRATSRLYRACVKTRTLNFAVAQKSA